MTVAGRCPSRNARICEAICSRGRPASGATSLVTARPSVPWQMAQEAARLRAPVPWASAAGARQASAAAMAIWHLIGILPGGWKTYPQGLEKQRPPVGGLCLLLRARSGDGGGFFLELELDLLVLADIDGHLAAVLQAAEQQLVGQRAANGVLDQSRHRARAHQRVEALAREVQLELGGEQRLDLLFGELLVELHQELVHHAQDDLVVERAERDHRIQPVAELRRE